MRGCQKKRKKRKKTHVSLFFFLSLIFEKTINLILIFEKKIMDIFSNIKNKSNEKWFLKN